MTDQSDKSAASQDRLPDRTPGRSRADRSGAPRSAPAFQPGQGRLLGAGKTAASAAAFGAKGATLDRLARSGAPVPPAWAIDAQAASRIRDGVPWEALKAFLSQGLEALASASATQGRLARYGDAKTPLALAVRLSPVTPLADLAPAILGIGLPDAAESATAPKAGRGQGAKTPAGLRRLFWMSFPPAALSEDAAARFADDPAQIAPKAHGDRLNGAERPFDDRDARWADALRDAAFAAAREEGEEGEAERFSAAVSDPLAQLATAVAALARAWDAQRCRRRRRAAGLSGAADGCALVLQAIHPAQLEGGGWGRVRLWDERTGAPSTSGLYRAGALHENDPADERALADADWDDPFLGPALRAAQSAEDALETPQEIEFALIPASGGAAGAPPIARILGARPLRPSSAAAVEIAVARAEAGRIAPEIAVATVPALGLQDLLHPSIEPDARRDLVARGLPASPGAAAGRLAFTAAEAEALAERGEPALLACVETRPEDVQGMHAAAAVLTTRGGLTSHAAVVARGLGRPCVVGAADAKIEPDAEGRPTLVSADGRRFGPGAWLTLDGAAGTALAGALPTSRPEPTGALAKLMGWADALRELKVRANADTPSDAETAARLGVDGVGLCRTEHMFFEPARITEMRRMILADTAEERRTVLERLLPMQRDDFLRVFEIMAGLETASPAARGEPAPVTIRLLDPPLHEFLPEDQRGLAAMARALGEPVEKVAARAWELREFNPMLGKRGCRVGVAYPEIYEMQTRAIFEAALEAQAKTGRAVRPEIMIPLVSAARELEMLGERIDAVATEIEVERGVRPAYDVGIMVETPRAALRAGALGGISAFFSFGTNDLTQMTYGLSRDDAGRLMRDYVERGVFEADPFQSLDQEGVGELIKMAIERGRAANPSLAIGLCGEHGGDPATIDFCQAAGFDYVSCSPFRAPIARLAAAQAAIRAARERSG